jgi:hypothetical protein
MDPSASAALTLSSPRGWIDRLIIESPEGDQQIHSM